MRSIQIFYSVTPLALILPLLFAFLKFRYLTNPYKIILLLLLATSVIDVLFLFGPMDFSDLSLFHLYTIIEFSLLSLFYSYFLDKGYSPYIILLAILFDIFCVVNFFFIQTDGQFNTYTRPLGSMIIIVYSMLFFARQSVLHEDEIWVNNGFNWINAGIIIYNASCLVLFILSNYLLDKGQEANDAVWVAHNIIMIFQYILFAVGFKKASVVHKVDQ